MFSQFREQWLGARSDVDTSFSSSAIGKLNRDKYLAFWGFGTIIVNESLIQIKYEGNFIWVMKLIL